MTLPVARLHLVTDFDGVWTEPQREARAVQRTVVREFARLAGWSEAAAVRCYRRWMRRVLERPAEHGWRIDGRLSSYVDEDFFALPAAIGQAIADADGDPEAEQLRAAILREHATVSDFMDACYHGTCARFRESVAHDLSPGAEEVLRWLLDLGARVTFVTNAPLAKVVDWFGCHGLEVADAADDARAGHPLRAYGRAGKQWLGPGREHLRFSDRRVWTDRPAYRAILERERPDVVLGDVLSLDLALPLALRAAGHPAAPRTVAILHRRHTPAWVRAAVAPGPGRLDHHLRHIRELPGVIQPLLDGVARPGT